MAATQFIKKQLALFMILLIGTMPFVFAETTLTITSYAGQDGVEGSISSFDDALSVEAEVTQDTEEATLEAFSENNVHIEIFGDEEVFDSCVESEEESGTYICVYTTTQTDRVASEKVFVVKVYGDDGTEVVSEEKDFLIDGEEPQIESIAIPKYFSDDLNITFKIEDTACPTCADCSGIQKIDLVFDDAVKEIEEVSTTGDEEAVCSYETTIETSVDVLDLDDGEQEFCAVVYDRVQNSDDACKTIIVDTTAPSISSSSFVIEDENGNAIEHVGTDALHATVNVNITETGSGLETDTVIANLSALNYGSSEEYQEVQGACDDYGNGLYVCQWDVLLDVLDEEGNLYDDAFPISIAAEDIAGNEGKLAKTVSFVQDDTSPIVLSLMSLNEGYLNAKNNTLILEIQEEESGFDDLNVYLDMREASLGQQQADRCEQSGTLWYCYWEEFVMPSSVSDGEQIDITQGTLNDDAGNSYDAETSIEEETFVYDKEAPEFLNVTISALGREAAVITEGDVVSILAYIADDVSGVDEENVFADFTDFDSSNDVSAADYCTEVSADIWECYWEYIGSLDVGEKVELNMIAWDNAGNSKDSDDDNVLAEIRVVGVIEEIADYWEEELEVDEVPMLNPNFLYFTSTGTLVRFDTELQSTTGTLPYVHSFQFESCQAAAHIVGKVGSLQWQDAAIVGEYYYDEADRTSKYVLVNLPALFYGQANASVEEGSSVDVSCIAAVSQARTVYSDIYAETELVNMTASVQLIAGLYTEPSLTTIDKIQKGEKLLKVLDTLTKILGFWSEWGQKICGPMNGIRVVANNIVTMLKSINILAGGEATPAVAGMVKVTNFLNSIWYGARNEEDYKATGRKVLEEDIVKGETLATQKFYKSDPTKIFQNKYKFPSIGFLCDTVLCESCSDTWNKAIDKWTGTGSEEDMPTGIYIAGEYVPNLLGKDIDWPFNPRENIVVALACWPPCVPGIHAQLTVYKEILVAYNTCLNIAVMKGEDIVQCDEFKSAQICQNLVNAFFWHWFWGGFQSAVAKFAVNMVFDAFEKEVAACTGTLQDFTVTGTACSTFRSVVALTTLTTTMVDTYNTLANIFNFEGSLFGNQTVEEQQEDLTGDVESDIGDQLGVTPTYG